MGGELAAATPDERVFEVVLELLVNAVANRLDRAASSLLGQHDGVAEIGLLPAFFRVDSHQRDAIPDGVEKSVDVEFLVDTDDHGVWSTGQFIDVFDGKQIDFVVDEDSLDVLSVAFDDVDQVVDVIIASADHISVVDLVLLHDDLDHLFVEVGSGEQGSEGHSSGLLFVDHDVRFLLVDSHAHCLELEENLRLMLKSLKRIKHNEQKI